MRDGLAPAYSLDRASANPSAGSQSSQGSSHHSQSPPRALSVAVENHASDSTGPGSTEGSNHLDRDANWLRREVGGMDRSPSEGPTTAEYVKSRIQGIEAQSQHVRQGRVEDDVPHRSTTNTSSYNRHGSPARERSGRHSSPGLVRGRLGYRQPGVRSASTSPATSVSSTNSTRRRHGTPPARGGMTKSEYLMFISGQAEKGEIRGRAPGIRHRSPLDGGTRSTPPRRCDQPEVHHDHGRVAGAAALNHVTGHGTQLTGLQSAEAVAWEAGLRAENNNRKARNNNHTADGAWLQDQFREPPRPQAREAPRSQQQANVYVNAAAPRHLGSRDMYRLQLEEAQRSLSER